MNWDAVAKGAAALATPVATIVGFLSRRRRLRAEVRDNLALLKEIAQVPAVYEHTPSANWLQGRIAIDVARLTGQEVGARKKPVPWGPFIFSLVLAGVFGGWVYVIDRGQFHWYSVFPGTLAFLFGVAALGLVTNRQLPPGDIPAGAIPLNRPAGAPALRGPLHSAAPATLGDRYDADGAPDVAMRFFALLAARHVEEGFDLAERNWRLCRVQAWLWNNREHFGSEHSLDDLAYSLAENRVPADIWQQFMVAEADAFAGVWSSLGTVGAASRERKVAPDYELVILTPVGDSGGFMVMTTTTLQSAITVLLHFIDNKWSVASHVAHAPPAPGWPPSWWCVEA